MTPTTPPWLDGIDPIAVSARFKALALPSRRFPGPPPDTDGEATIRACILASATT